MPAAEPYRITNTGKTPAKDITVTWQALIYKRGERPQFPLQNPGPTIRAKTGLLVPNSWNAFLVGVLNDKFKVIPLTPEINDAIDNKQSYVMIRMLVDYRDVFGTGHWTHYCAIIGGQFAVSDECSAYNDADNNY
jgi:hypothetical protein